MNTQRMLILGLAAIAAVAAALLVRGLLGGGTPKSAAALPPQVAMSDVLVASSDLQPGQHLDVSQVRWQSWPRKSIDSSFITASAASSNAGAVVNGTVVRAPIVAGEPITNAKIVHTDAAGVMAASVAPGMRALAISVTTDTGAGGFILPNDRVDVLSTVQVSEQPKRYRTKILLENLRVLAMDQIFKEDKDQKVVLAKTATLEVDPNQARQIMQAQAVGPLSLALRSLSDSTTSAITSPAPIAAVAAPSGAAMSANMNEGMSIIRYGVAAGGNDGGQ